MEKNKQVKDIVEQWVLLMLADPKTQEYCVSEMAKEINENYISRTEVEEIWRMSQALYNQTVEFSDVTKSNYEALKKINKHCAKLLSARSKEQVRPIKKS